MKGTLDVNNTANMSPEAAEFVRRLRQEMARRDWNGAELARQAALHMPDGKFGRDLITRYRRGARPRDAHLVAMAAALHMKPNELFPGMWEPPHVSKAVTPRATTPAQPNATASIANGKVRLQIDQEVDMATAAKVFEALGASSQ